MKSKIAVAELVPEPFGIGDLVISSVTSSIVLVTDRKAKAKLFSGVIVHVDPPCNQYGLRPGQYSEDLRMDCFRRWTGAVILDGGA